MKKPRELICAIESLKTELKDHDIFNIGAAYAYTDDAKVEPQWDIRVYTDAQDKSFVPSTWEGFDVVVRGIVRAGL